MFAAFLTPGPWQIIIVAMIVILLFGGWLPNLVERLANRPKSKDETPQVDLNACLQNCASIALIVAAYYLMSTGTAILFGAVLVPLALLRR